MQRLSFNPPTVYLLVGIWFVFTRIGFYLIGLHFDDSDIGIFMSYLDLDLLKNDPWRSLFYFHQKPPGMNFYMGTVLQLFGGHADFIFALSFKFSGLILILCLTYLLFQLRLPAIWILVLTFGYAIIPPNLLYENYLLYTYPTSAWLCLCAVIFQQAVIRQKVPWWILFFHVAALLTLTRNLFHLIWFLGCLGLALSFSTGFRKQVVITALLPLLLIIGLYLKNLVLFGLFGSSSQASIGFARTVIQRQPENVRKKWVTEEQISGIELIHPFAGPEAYFPVLGKPVPTGIPALDRLEKSSGYPNYNHLIFLKVYKIHLQDGIRIIWLRPVDYLKTVGRNLIDYLSPASTWHPGDESSVSPFFPHRQSIGSYERFFNMVIHGKLFGRPVGLLLFLFPFTVIYGIIYVSRGFGRRNGKHADARRPLFIFLYLNIGYVTAISCLLETGSELSRYRYLIDPFLVIGCLMPAWDLIKTKFGIGINLKSQ